MKRLLSFLVFISLSSLAFSQNMTPVKSWGFDWPRGGFDSVLYLPTGCGAPSGIASLKYTWSDGLGHTFQGQILRMAALMFDSCGHKWYGFDPTDSSWSVMGSGGGGGSAGSADSIRKIPVDTTGMGAGGGYMYYDIPSGTYKFRAITSAQVVAALSYAPLAPADTTYLHNLAAGKRDVTDTTYAHLLQTRARGQQIVDSLGAIKVANLLGTSFLGYGSHANRPTAGAGIYYDTDSSAFFYYSSGTGLNMTPVFNLFFRGAGGGGDTTIVFASGSTIFVAAQRDSAGSCIHHIVNPDHSWTWYTTCGTGSAFDSLTSQGGVFHTGAYNDARYAVKANNLADLPNATTARTNLGLGTSATHNVPASGNAASSEVVLGNDTRLGTGGTVTADTTLSGNGSGGSPLGVNQNIVNAAYWVLVHPYPSTNNTLFYGNSITYGYCPSCGSGTEVAYPTILQNGLGNTTVNNGAVSSTGIRTAYNYLSSTMPVAGAPTVGEAAFNNIRILMTGDTLHRFGHVKSGYRAIAALQFLNPATIQFYFTGSGAGSVNSNITTSLACGSCTAAIDTLKDFSSRAVFYRASVAGQSGTNWWLKSSITTNETVTIANVRGAGIVIGTWADSVGWSRIQVAVDGSVVTTYNPNDRVTMLNFDATFHRFGIQNDAIVIQGLQDTLHTVVLTFLDGTKMGGFDYVAGLKNPASCYTTPAYIYDIMHMGAAGYSYSLAPTTQAVQDSCNNSRWYDLFNNFGTYGYPVYQVHENYPVGHYNPGGDPTQIQIDGIHPTGLGQRNIAIDGLATMNYRQNYNATASAPSAPTLPVGPTGAVQFAGAAGFAGTSDVVIDSTNKGVTYGGYLEAQAINSSNAFFGYNAKVVSGSYTYINTAPASGLQFFVGGGLGFFANPSGTAAASFTRTFPFYANTSGQIQLGGNVSFTPSSFVDLPAATTSNASLYIAPGSQPTSGLKVGLFYTTSAGHFFFHNGTAFQQLDAQVPGTATTNNLMYWTGTQVGGFGKWDATNNWLALGANAPTPFSDLSVNHNFAGFTEFRVSNSNAGGQSGFQAVNDQAGAIGIRAAGSTIGNVGPWLQGSGVLYNNINNDMGIMNNSAHDVYVATGSGTASDKFRIFSGGQIGLTTYTGTTFYKHLDSTNYKLLVQDAAGKLWSTDWPTFGSGSSAPFSDATAIAKNSSDATKQFKFDLSSVTTGNTRTMTVPDFDFTPATLGHAQTYTAANTFATASGSKLILSGNATTAPSTGHGAAIDGQAFSVTDQSAGSLLASYIMQPITYNSSSSNTYTAQPAGLYVAPPIAGSNTTFSVPAVAIWADGDILTKHTICNIGSTVSAGAGAGTAPSVSTAGSDIDGSITVITGTSPTVSAIVATITYGEHFPTNSFVTLTPANDVTAALNGATMVFATGSTTNFTITSGSSALAASTTYKWYYHVGGN